jgi:hypothetical protein
MHHANPNVPLPSTLTYHIFKQPSQLVVAERFPDQLSFHNSHNNTPLPTHAMHNLLEAPSPLFRAEMALLQTKWAGSSQSNTLFRSQHELKTSTDRIPRAMCSACNKCLDSASCSSPPLVGDPALVRKASEMPAELPAEQTHQLRTVLKHSFRIYIFQQCFKAIAKR